MEIIHLGEHHGGGRIDGGRSLDVIVVWLKGGQDGNHRDQRDDDDYDDDPRAQARTPGGGNDAVGIIGLILGCISGVLVMAACCTGGVTLFAAVPFSVIGFIVSVCGTGTPKTLGLVFNSLVFIPAVILLVLMLCGFATYLIHRP